MYVPRPRETKTLLRSDWLKLSQKSAVAIGGRRLVSAICYLRFSTVAIRSSNGRPHSNLIWRSDRT